MFCRTGSRLRTNGLTLDVHLRAKLRIDLILFTLRASDLSSPPRIRRVWAPLAVALRRGRVVQIAFASGHLISVVSRMFGISPTVYGKPYP